MRITKTFFGIVLCLCAFGFIITTEQVNKSTQPFFILFTGLCIFAAVMLLKKSKREKATGKKIKKSNMQSAISQKSTSNGNRTPVTTEYEPILPKYPNKDIDMPSDSYIFDANGNASRTDGKQLNDADATYLMNAGYEFAKRNASEIKSRIFINHVITDEKLNVNEIKFFNALTENLTESKLDPGKISINKLSSGALNVYYLNMYVGKIFLSETDTIFKYRVIKNGNIRATRVFDNYEAAKKYIQDKVDYYIEEQKIHISSWMQYLTKYDSYNLNDIDVKVAIDSIPKWIHYIKLCAREHKKAMAN